MTFVNRATAQFESKLDVLKGTLSEAKISTRKRKQLRHHVSELQKRTAQHQQHRTAVTVINCHVYIILVYTIM